MPDQPPKDTPDIAVPPSPPQSDDAKPDISKPDLILQSLEAVNRAARKAQEAVANASRGAAPPRLGGAEPGAEATALGDLQDLQAVSLEAVRRAAQEAQLAVASAVKGFSSTS